MAKNRLKINIRIFRIMFVIINVRILKNYLSLYIQCIKKLSCLKIHTGMPFALSFSMHHNPKPSMTAT